MNDLSETPSVHRAGCGPVAGQVVSVSPRARLQAKTGQGDKWRRVEEGGGGWRRVEEGGGGGEDSFASSSFV
jgi:hypothetical protein